MMNQVFAVVRQHRGRWLSLVLLLALMLAGGMPILSVMAASGDLDVTFDGDGKWIDPLYGNFYDIAVQPDGRILGVGINNGFLVARFNSDGTRDTTFNGNGAKSTSLGGDYEPARSVLLQADGKIIVVGTTRSIVNADLSFGILRLNSDGTVDTTFGDGSDGHTVSDFGFPQEEQWAATLQPDGKVVAVGSTGEVEPTDSDVMVVRYNSDGTVDTSFASSGIYRTELGANTQYDHDAARSVALQPDGSILVGGMLDGDPAIFRLTSAGALDSSFGTGGILSIPGSSNSFASGLFVLPNGSFYVAGTSNTGKLQIIRYVSTGMVDSTFGQNGITELIGIGVSGLDTFDLSIISNQVAVTARSGSDVHVVLLNSDGSIDTTFGSSGVVATDVNGFTDFVYGIAIQPDGKILVSGGFNYGTGYNAFLLRYEGNISTALPLLDIPDDLVAQPDSSFDVPLVFTGNGNSISAVDLTLNYPTSCLTPDLTDTNPADGIPDNFVLNQSGFQIGVDSTDATNGSIQIVISADAEDASVATFADGDLLTIPFEVAAGCSGPVDIDLSATSWGDSSGQSTQGETEGGSVYVNSPPDAEDDYFTVGEDVGSVTGNLFVNNGAGADSDPDGDTLIVAAVNGSAANVGQAINLGDATVTVQSDGSFVYSFGAAYNWLAFDETQVDFFSYELSDGSLTDIGTVEITVNGENDTPTISFMDDMEVLEPGFTFSPMLEFADPDTSDTVSIDVDWGDGSPHWPVDTGENSSTYMGSKAYENPGVFTVTGTADDGNGGTATDTMLAVVGTRGDCNGDGPVDAGDLPALVLEYFDGDDSDNWLDTLGAGSTFAGNPVGCDANADAKITAGDLSCQINILLDPAGYSCAGTTAANATQAMLSIAAVDAAQSGPVRVPVTLQTNGHSVVAAVFSLNLGGHAFDATDADGNGLPDAVSVNLPGNVQAMAFYDPADVGSELDLVLFSDSLTPFPDGELLSVTLTNAGTVTFSADSPASLGAADGSSVPVLAQEGVTAERKLYLPFTTR